MKINRGRKANGKYWEFCSIPDHDCPTIITLDIDLKKYRRNQKTAHTFSTAITYQAFEAIFIRCCSQCIPKAAAEQKVPKADMAIGIPDKATKWSVLQKAMHSVKKDTDKQGRKKLLKDTGLFTEKELEFL